MDAIVAELIRQGVLGLVLAALILGLLVPKYVVDELRRQLAIKDGIIERQSGVIERLAEKARPDA